PPRPTFFPYTTLFRSLGNCLVQQARGFARPLREATAQYEACVQEPDLASALADDVRHNMELTKLLLLDARAAPDDQGRPPNESEDRKSTRLNSSHLVI